MWIALLEVAAGYSSRALSRAVESCSAIFTFTVLYIYRECFSRWERTNFKIIDYVRLLLKNLTSKKTKFERPRRRGRKRYLVLGSSRPREPTFDDLGPISTMRLEVHFSVQRTLVGSRERKVGIRAPRAIHWCLERLEGTQGGKVGFRIRSWTLEVCLQQRLKLRIRQLYLTNL